MGFGKVGTEVARRAKGLGMNVISHDPYAPADRARALGVELVSFDQAISTADFISLHMPLTPATKKVFNDETFSKMKDIESLDLSFNKLYGPIPFPLTGLNSLAVFNVSYNNLSGTIPHGKQFNTFGEISYFRNPLLCGPPTNRSSDINNTKEPDEEGSE